jgi:hypothetical protein
MVTEFQEGDRTSKKGFYENYSNIIVAVFVLGDQNVTKMNQRLIRYPI